MSSAVILKSVSFMILYRSMFAFRLSNDLSKIHTFIPAEDKKEILL